MDPSLTPLLLPAYATAAAYILVFMGLKTRRLGPRHPRCPTCGRDRRVCTCRHL